MKNFLRSIKDLFDIRLAICLIVVCILFLPTLNRPWLIYDERIISDSIYFPKANSFSELFEILQTFGLHQHVLSSNTMYSSNYITRTCPFGLISGMLLSFFFKANSFYYRLFNLALHLVNIILVYSILKLLLNKVKQTNFIVPVLTLLWGVHPVMMESVLLAINYGSLISYMFFFVFLLDFLKNKEKNNSLLRRFFIPLLFMIPMLTNEYIITLPLVLFTFSFYENYKNNDFKKSISLTITHTKPYFIGLFIYILYFFFISHYTISQTSNHNYFLLLIERIFWLSPQIFFHLLKLVFFPLKLSIDQGVFVTLGKSLFDPYPIFCIFLMSIWLFVPLVVFLLKRRLANLFLLTWSFFFALLPFLHILMPSYTLAAERYLYAPLAMMVIGVGVILSEMIHKGGVPRYALTVILLLSILLTGYFIRSYNRTQDWKDNYSFINSSYKTANNSFFKAVRLGMLGKAISIIESNKQNEIKQYFQETIVLLNKAKEEALENKTKFQKHLPLIIKSYGLDYNSLLTRIAFLEASSLCLELKQDHKIGLSILEPYIKNIKKTDPRIIELYTHFLNEDGRYKEARDVLLKTNSIYPKTPFILMALVDLFSKYENDFNSAEKYLLEALKLLPYDKDILLKALGFYQGYKDPSVTARYAYLYGLRAQSKPAYEQALSLYLNLGDINKASTIASKLLKLDPNDPELLYFVSMFYYKVKDFKKAISLLSNGYEICRRTNISDVLRLEIGYTLSRLHLQTGNKNAAIIIARDIPQLATTTEDLKKLAVLYNSLGLTDYLNYCLNKFKLLNKTN